MSKKQQNERGVKSEGIREMLKAGITKPKEIIEKLGTKGIVVTEGLINSVKQKEGYTKKRTGKTPQANGIDLAFTVLKLGGNIQAVIKKVEAYKADDIGRLVADCGGVESALEKLKALEAELKIG